eukprot:3686933-Amphidinium_carterae.1
MSGASLKPKSRSSVSMGCTHSVLSHERVLGCRALFVQLKFQDLFQHNLAQQLKELAFTTELAFST